jgi:hypothetical protein
MQKPLDLHVNIGIYFDISTDGFILDKNKLNEWRHVIMEVSINSGISNIGIRNVDQNNEKTFDFKNIGQKSEKESEFVMQVVGQKGETINVFA